MSYGGKGVKHKARDRRRDELAPKVWEMYVAGHSYRDIAEKLDIATMTCHSWVKADVQKLVAKRTDLAEGYLEVELARLDFLLEILIKDVTHTIAIDVQYEDGKKVMSKELVERADVQVVDRILKVQERRAKYLNLDAAKEIKVTHTTIEDLIIATMQPHKMLEEATLIDDGNTIDVTEGAEIDSE